MFFFQDLARWLTDQVQPSKPCSALHCFRSAAVGTLLRSLHRPLIPRKGNLAVPLSLQPDGSSIRIGFISRVSVGFRDSKWCQNFDVEEVTVTCHATHGGAHHHSDSCPATKTGADSDSKAPIFLPSSANVLRHRSIFVLVKNHCCDCVQRQIWGTCPSVWHSVKGNVTLNADIRWGLLAVPKSAPNESWARGEANHHQPSIGELNLQ